MPQAFEDWYWLAHPVVLGVVAMACGDVDVAGEATDEAFVRALDRWDRVNQMTSPRAWVCHVALNVMRRHYRRRQLERLFLTKRTITAPGGPADVYPELWVRLRGLPNRQRTAVLLRYVGDLTEAEVGTAMGISRGAVSASLTAARSRLAQDLGPVYDSEDSPYA